MSTDAYLRSVELKLRTWVFFCAKAEVDVGAEADGGGEDYEEENAE